MLVTKKEYDAMVSRLEKVLNDQNDRIKKLETKPKRKVANKAVTLEKSEG